MNQMRRFGCWCIAFLLSISASSYASQSIQLDGFEAGTIGKHIQFFQEREGQKLSLKQAIETFTSQDVRQGTGNSISLGIGVDPVWLRFSVEAPKHWQQRYQLFVETPGWTK